MPKFDFSSHKYNTIPGRCQRALEWGLAQRVASSPEARREFRCRFTPGYPFHRSTSWTLQSKIGNRKSKIEWVEAAGRNSRQLLDPEYGFPRVIAIDSPPGVADGGGGWQV